MIFFHEVDSHWCVIGSSLLIILFSSGPFIVEIKRIGAECERKKAERKSKKGGRTDHNSPVHFYTLCSSSGRRNEVGMKKNQFSIIINITSHQPPHSPAAPAEK